MAKVKTKTITNVRDNIYSETEKPGAIAITRGGKFVGVLLTTGTFEETISEQLHRSLRDNPVHAISLITKQAIG